MKVDVSALLRDYCPYRKTQLRSGSFSLCLIIIQQEEIY